MTAWAVWTLRCAACGYRQVSVAPVGVRPPLECAACHQMAAQ